ncbi:hypothetical protein [Candidatus Sororendozoicomonas aggregata]|uniref:hypothetical protein n=1 Tax=Candidatus Sororendozoicomonas aggregata TaxID=3073239 RepID=UPI002ED2DCEB
MLFSGSDPDRGERGKSVNTRSPLLRKYQRFVIPVRQPSTMTVDLTLREMTPVAQTVTAPVFYRQRGKPRTSEDCRKSGIITAAFVISSTP